jgi:hypothetical protein
MRLAVHRVFSAAHLYVRALVCLVVGSSIVLAQSPTTPPARPLVPNPAPGAAPKTPAAPLTAKDQEKLQKRLEHRKLMDEFFAGPIVRLEIKLEPKEWEALQKENREYVEATIVEVGPDGRRPAVRSSSWPSFRRGPARPGSHETRSP